MSNIICIEEEKPKGDNNNKSSNENKETSNNNKSSNENKEINNKTSNNNIKDTKKYYYYKENLFKEYGLCGIKNYGANCYLNSGLQIISRCNIFIDWLKKSDYPDYACPFFNILKKTIQKILDSEHLDPNEFITYFSKNNSEFPPNNQNCSQLFVRTVFSNINKEIKDFILDINNKQYHNEIDPIIKGYHPEGYEKISYESFLFNNKVFPQTLAYSYFSGIMKTESTGICKKCGEVKKYSFMDFFDQHMYLDTITSFSTDFKNVLKENLGYPIKVRSSCPYCKDRIQFEDISKIIKLPEILVFTIERYIGDTNTIPIIPNEIIDLKDYVENSSIKYNDTLYELFAINIRFGYSNQFGHQICQIKKENNWYTLNDNNSPKKSQLDEYIKNSYGLYYKRIKSEDSDIN